MPSATLADLLALAKKYGVAAADDACAAALEFLAEIRYVPYTTLAFAYEVPGGEEAFFRLMEQAIAEREPLARTVRWRKRRFARFASDSRYDALLEKVGLSDQHVAQSAAVDLAG